MASNTRRSLTWDEAAIEEHNKERGTRQKILEPPTPYAYSSDHDEEEHEEEEDSENLREAEYAALKGPQPVEIKDSMAELSAKLEYHKHLADEDPESISRSKDEKRSFADRRAEHYNEFKVIQALRARKAGAFDDDEEDDEEEKGEVESKENHDPMDTS